MKIVGQQHLSGKTLIGLVPLKTVARNRCGLCLRKNMMIVSSSMYPRVNQKRAASRNLYGQGRRRLLEVVRPLNTVGVHRVPTAREGERTIGGDPPLERGFGGPPPTKFCNSR